tara:strand:- start:644 stop:2362 length:1719 start_codon:yes stop_codon:yes gene_type:complete
VFKNILSILDHPSKKKLFILILSNIFIGILEMISFSSIYVYIKFVLFDDLIFDKFLLEIYPSFFEFTKFNQTIILSIIIFCLFTFKNLILILLLRIEARITEIIFFNLKKKICQIFFQISFQQLSFKYTTDEIINILMKDTEKYRYALTEFVKISRETIIICSLIILIFLQSYLLSIFALIFFLILSCLIVFYFRPIIKKLGARLRITDGLLIKKSINTFLSIKIIKIFKKELFFQKDLTNSISELENINKRFYFMSYQPKIFFEITTVFLILFIIVFLTFLDSDIKEFTPLVTLIAATFIRMMPSFSVISSSFNAIKYNEPSVVKLRENLEFLKKFDLKINVVKKKYENQIDDKIKINLNNINFKFKDKTIFENLNMKIPSNSFVSIYGESGVGKSTLLNILLGLYKPSSGEVLINNKNINQNINEWFSKVGYVDQETVILNNHSLLENVAFGEENPNLDLFYSVMKKVNLYKFFISLPEKENTKLNEFGKNLSGGQKQRIGIARALYRRPKVLLLDEPTSALDETNEIEIFEYLKALKKEMIIFMVTHKIKAKNYSDQSYTIKNNNIIEI